MRPPCNAGGSGGSARGLARPPAALKRAVTQGEHGNCSEITGKRWPAVQENKAVSKGRLPWPWGQRQQQAPPGVELAQTEVAGGPRTFLPRTATLRSPGLTVATQLGEPDGDTC